MTGTDRTVEVYQNNNLLYKLEVPNNVWHYYHFNYDNSVIEIAKNKIDRIILNAGISLGHASGITPYNDFQQLFQTNFYLATIRQHLQSQDFGGDTRKMFLLYNHQFQLLCSKWTRICFVRTLRRVG